jgi:hypothetical protein
MPKLHNNIWTAKVSLPKQTKFACTETTRGILFVLHYTVMDSSAWQRPQIYCTQQDPSSIYYASTGCQWYSKSTMEYCSLQQGHTMQYRAYSLADDHKEFICNKLADMVKAGHWIVIPYSAIQHATDIQITPLGILPQQDCRLRPIVDYTFSDVNKAVVKLAPSESMQFGKALDRIIQEVAEANLQHGIVNLSKLNLADTFMRAGLSPFMMVKLAVVVPTTLADKDP